MKRGQLAIRDDRLLIKLGDGSYCYLDNGEHYTYPATDVTLLENGETVVITVNN